MPRIDAFLELAREQGCSDIHFSVGLPPMVRLDGEMTPVKYRVLTEEEISGITTEIMDEEHRRELAEKGSVDLSYAAATIGRFRVNVCRHSRGLSVICRIVPGEVPRLADLGLPRVISRFTSIRSGLVLVTGATGTGKSTTLAAFINEINETRSLNIVTLEDPVEFVHHSKQSLVVHREIGTHVRDFREGLRSALRQDPDVILVGEMRDYETISLAIEAAETGHLVVGTLHTRGAAQTIDRIIDAFPADAQTQVRHTLADNLKCVMSQELLRAADGRGRRVAMEILVVTPAVSQHIREGKTFQINGVIQTGRRLGMQLLDQNLLALVKAGDVNPDEAFLKAIDGKELAHYVTDKSLLEFSTPVAASGGLK